MFTLRSLGSATPGQCLVYFTQQGFVSSMKHVALTCTTLDKPPESLKKSLRSKFEKSPCAVFRSIKSLELSRSVRQRWFVEHMLAHWGSNVVTVPCTYFDTVLQRFLRNWDKEYENFEQFRHWWKLKILRLQSRSGFLCWKSWKFAKQSVIILDFSF